MAWSMEELYWGLGNCSIPVMCSGSLALGSGETQGSIFWDDICGDKTQEGWFRSLLGAIPRVSWCKYCASLISRSTSYRALTVYSRWSKWSKEALGVHLRGLHTGFALAPLKLAGKSIPDTCAASMSPIQSWVHLIQAGPL